MVCAVLSEESGFWKTIWMRLRCVLVRRTGGSGPPSSRVMPAAGVMRPAATRASVDLPAPDSPTMPSAPPRGSASDTSSTAAKPS